MADPRSAQKRRQSEKRGRFAETVAAFYLRAKGFSILDQRFKSQVGEVDLIARRGSLLIFVEVKWRKMEESALEAVTPHTQVRIARAAALYLARNPQFSDLSMRFDVIALAPWRWPVHLKGAFESAVF